MNKATYKTDWTPGLYTSGLLVGSLIAIVLLTISLVLAAAFGEWNEGCALCASFIIAGIAGGLLQQFWFRYSSRPTFYLNYAARIAGFGITYFIVLAGCAWLGEWLPLNEAGAWVSFAIIYLVILGVLTFVLSRAIQKSGASYSEQLAAYRAKQRECAADE